MILVQNSMSLAFSNAFVPTSQLTCIQKQKKKKKSQQEQTKE